MQPHARGAEKGAAGGAALTSGQAAWPGLAAPRVGRGGSDERAVPPPARGGDVSARGGGREGRPSVRACRTWGGSG